MFISSISASLWSSFVRKLDMALLVLLLPFLFLLNQRRWILPLGIAVLLLSIPWHLYTFDLRPQSEVTAGIPLTLFNLVFIPLVPYVVLLIFLRQIRLIFTSEELLVALLFPIMLFVELVFADRSDNAVFIKEFIKATQILIVFLLVQTITTRQGVRVALKVILTSGVIAAGVAIAQHSVLINGGESLLDGQILFGSNFPFMTYRVAIPFLDPNFAAMFHTGILGVALGMRGDGNWTWRQRRLLDGVIALSAAAILLAGSRGGVTATLAVVLVFCMVMALRSPCWWKSGLPVLISILAIIAVPLIALRQAKDTDFVGEQGRMELLKSGIAIMLDNPFGVGLLAGGTHNAFIQLGVQLGFPSMFILLGLFGLGFYKAFRLVLWRVPGGISLLLALVGVCTAHMFLGEILVAKVFWIYIGLIAVLYRMVAIERRAANPDSPK